MNSSNDSDAIYLVIPLDQTAESVSKRLKETYDQLNAHGMEPSWTKTEECLKLKKFVNSLFICEPFSGDAYHHLLKLGCRILGPLCLLTCLKDATNLPKRSRPIFSLNMRHVVVTFSNIPVEKKRKWKEMILMMGGECLNSLTQSCTHLVTGCVGSEKYVTAIRLKLPVMTPDWIISCWTEVQKNVMDVQHCTDVFYAKFNCKPFYGLVVTASQLDTKERQKIQSLVTEHGGRYSGAMKYQDTTHLVLETPSGNKFEHARSWNIKCIRKDWVLDCVKAGSYLVEDSYELLPDGNIRQNKASTPKKDERPFTAPNCSVLLPNNALDCVNETCLSNVSFILAPAKSVRGEALKESAQNYLQECKVYFCGFDNKELSEFEVCIQSAGGTVCKELSSGLTHIVCADINYIPRNLPRVNSNVQIVSPDWIRNCIKAKTILPEEKYLSKLDNSSKFNLSSNSGQANIFEEQYGSNMENVESISLGENSRNGKKNTNSLVMCQEDKENMVEGQSDSCLTAIKVPDLSSSKLESVDKQDSLQKCIFSEMEFVILEPNQEDKSLLVEMLQSHGGRVHDFGSCLPNNCVWIVPVIQTECVAVPANQIVRTNFWVQICVEEETLHPVNANRLFEPMCILSSDKPPLEGFVLAFSQFSSSEKNCLVYLANMLGATYSEYFVRVPNKKKGLLPNTHLILSSPKGDKYEAACKWNIPAVHKEWLFQAALQNQSPDEKLFLITNPPPKLSSEDGQMLTSDQKPKKSLSDELYPNEISLKPSIPKSFETSDWKPEFDVSKAYKLLANTGIDIKRRSLTVAEAADQVFAEARRNCGIASPAAPTSALNILANNPLSGVVLCVSRKLVSQRKKLHSITEKLGGAVLWSYDDSCTHLVHQGRSNEHLGYGVKEFRQAQAKSKFIVSPEWLIACEESMSRVNEDDFPYNFNPRLTLSGQVVSEKLNSSVKNLSSENKTSPVMDSSLVKPQAHSPKKAVLSPVLTPVRNISLASSLVESPKKSFSHNPVNTPLQSSTSRIKAPRSLRSSSFPQDDKESEKSDSNLNQDFSKRIEVSKQLQELMNIRKDSLSSSSVQRVSAESRDFKIKQVLPLPKMHPEPETQPSQVNPIMWEDPTEKRELERLAQNPAPVIEIDSQEMEEEEKADEDHTLDAPTQKVVCKKIFLLSGLKDDKKNVCQRIIEQLGGEVSESYSFQVTHLVCECPSKNEKTLSSIAAGVWILHPSFLEASDKASQFLPEEDFEWGSEMMKAKIQLMPTKVQKIATAAHAWRSRVAATGKRAFHDWEVKLVVPQQRMAAYTSILKAGGARLIDKFTAGFSVPKFAFLEGQFDVKCEDLRSESVTCVKPEYFSAVLVEFPAPSPNVYAVNDAQFLQDSTKQKRRIESVNSTLKKNRSR